LHSHALYRRYSAWLEASRKVLNPLFGCYLGGKQNIFHETERDDSQYQNDAKENDAAVLESFPARNLDTVEYPIGHEIKTCGHYRVIKNFQVDSPLMYYDSLIILCRRA